ncbi:hypothetical protein DFQ27_004969 [Actinomortierella ambigua]|uniref:Protein kinase domain-containing protein n=1 Tax=Actinomortierella ambigua TaxID=1343610 RepID=A0A9P6QME3_9FUNG|nr:hypothetical protein DFQ27_004969 [Actinomortierella ambigua]
MCMLMAVFAILSSTLALSQAKKLYTSPASKDSTIMRSTVSCRTCPDQNCYKCQLGHEKTLRANTGGLAYLRALVGFQLPNVGASSSVVGCTVQFPAFVRSLPSGVTIRISMASASEWDEDTVTAETSPDSEEVIAEVAVPARTNLPPIDITKACTQAGADGQFSIYLSTQFGSIEVWSKDSDNPAILHPTLVLGQKLGSGAYGTVYRGEWGVLAVAAKKFHVTATDDAQTAIKKEIKVLKGLTYRHIIQFYGAHYHDGGLVVLTDLAEGGSLRAAIDRGIPDWATKERYAREISLGLAYIHSKGVLHLDLKSDNVLLSGLLEVKLCDFGCATVKTTSLANSAQTQMQTISAAAVAATTAAAAAAVAGPSSSSQILRGTVRWMAPELFIRKPKYSPKSDMYSLGVVMWEMAADCTTPFKGHYEASSIIALVKAGTRENLPEGTPKGYGACLERCWDQDPARRPEACEFVSLMKEMITVHMGNAKAEGEKGGPGNPSTLSLDLDSLSIGSFKSEGGLGSHFSKSATQKSRSNSHSHSSSSGSSAGGASSKVTDADRVVKSQPSRSALASTVQVTMDFPASTPKTLVAVVSRDMSVSKPQTVPPTTAAAQTGPMVAAHTAVAVASVAAVAVGTATASSTTPKAVAAAVVAVSSENLDKKPAVAVAKIEDMESLLQNAKLGHTDSQVRLGLIYLQGQGVAQSDSQAASWFLNAARLGHVVAQRHLGQLYAKERGQGDDVKKKHLEAASWLRKAADQGDGMAQNDLGWMYASGHGVKKNDTEAVKWFTKAAVQDHAEAQMSLGHMCTKGRGIARSETAAFQWFRLAGRLGHADAQNSVGWRYDLGEGVAQDDVKALEWYNLSVAEGNGYAMFNAASFYELGLGTKRDVMRALQLFQQAADNEEPNAQFHVQFIQWLTAPGRQPPKTAEEAVAMYRKGVDEGFTAAHHNLGRAYERGLGVRMDMSMAMAWYATAAGQGHGDSKQRLRFLQKTVKQET